MKHVVAAMFAFFLAATAAAQVTVSGSVTDPSGAGVPRAAITLNSRDAVVAETASDDRGLFAFDRVAPGRYTLQISAGSAFNALRREINVGAVAPPPLALRLALATVEESVDVTADEIRPSTDTAANLDTTRLSGNALEQLPVFDQDIVGAVTQFLDPASIATGGATIVVDGVEVKRAAVPKSAIQEIAINDDPYSAESNRPGRGRIEIITKPGSGHLRGTVGFTFRNASLAARNYFAQVKPPEQRQAEEGVFSGPLGKSSSFLMTFSRQQDDAAAVVHALTLNGALDETIAAPSSRNEVMARISHDWSEKHRGSLQINWQRQNKLLQGAGGIVLPQAGVNSGSREDDLFFNVFSTLAPTRLNQFQLTVEVNREPTTSVSNAPALIVRDAFVSGGAQATNLRTESGGKLNDVVTLSRGRSVIKFGVQVPNLNRRVWTDRTNQGGTFSFATLADFAAGRPYAYSIQQGVGRASFWWREYGAFVQEQIKLAPNLQAAFGLRYDWQSFFGDTNNFAPRGSLAWDPGKNGKLIVRGGAGVFYDRSGVGPVAAVMLRNGQNLRSYTILNPSYPDPLAGITLAALPVDVTRLARDVQIPWTLQYSASVERQLTKSAAFVAGYRASRGHHLFRSVDVNAPLPPDYTRVPDPSSGHIQEIRSDGRLQTDALELTLRGRAGKRLSGQVQYSLSRAMNDTGGIFWYPADQYAPPSAEWGPADFDVRHRLNALATVNAGGWGSFGLSGRFTSGLPYSETAGVDRYRTALSNARPPGTGRNTLRAASYSVIDVRWSRELALTGEKGDRAKTMTVALDAFNVLNHPNFTGYIGNVRSPFFLSPTSVQPGRRIQLSAEMRFGG